MNITSLHYFVSAAELSSFTKAAKVHYVAQTAISQQIAKLESSLQVELFSREKNRVALTPAGELFYEEVKEVLKRYDAAVHKVQRFCEERKSVITIGYKERCEVSLLTNVIREYQKIHPKVEIVLKEDSIPRLLDEVKHGICDFIVNISCTFSKEDLEHLNSYTIHRGEMLIAMSYQHEKADREYLENEDIREEKFIVYNVGNDNRGIDAMNEHSRQDGYTIRIQEFAPSMGALIMAVEMNRGLAFVQDLMERDLRHHVRCLPIQNSSHQYNVDLVWSKESENKTIKSFLSFLQKKLPVKGA